jgi:predicted helicase
MPTAHRIERAVRDVRDFDSLVEFCGDVLGWDIEPSRALEDVTFEWSADDLSLSESLDRLNSTGRETVRTSKGLAVSLARLAEEVRVRARAALAAESGRGGLRKFYEAFRETLVQDLREDDFADMYAQTVACGILSASIARRGVAHAADGLKELAPNTNPFLRELTQTFLTDFDELGVNEVFELLRRTRMDEVLNDFGARSPSEDPVIHFYELFLKEYDPKKRMQRGVFYTPRPVVSFIVRSVDEILRADFGLEDGLADTTTWGEMRERNRTRNPKSEIRIPEGVRDEEPFVQILDPATGTGTFLVEVIDRIHTTMRAKWSRRGVGEREIRELWNDYVPRHLLPRLHGFELMLAPYAVAHMNIGLKLAETNYRFLSTESARVYLTNTLEEPKDFDGCFERTALTHEARAANRIKRVASMTVVIGNPPYSHMSANLSDDARKIVEPYRFLDGERIRERGAIMFERTIQDDYVKFFAKSCSLLSERAGVLAFISNSAYTHNPTLRGMRRELLRRFTRLFILDLHGDRKSLDGGDQNVFDIRTGVAISILSRTPVETASEQVSRSDLACTRASKYKFLLESSASSLNWKGVSPAPPFYLFRHVESDVRDEFDKCWSVDDAFNLKSEGVKTNRDHFVVDFNDAPIRERLNTFTDARLSDDSVEEVLGLNDNAAWKVRDAREECRKTFDERHFTNVAFRPFDTRRLYYHPCVVFSPRPVLLNHVLNRRNLVLLTLRRIRTSGHAHFFITKLAAMKEMLSSADNCNVYPLYEYPASKSKPDFDVKAVANLRESFQKSFAALLGLSNEPAGRGDLVTSVGPEDYLHYMYAVFHSPAYRERYAEFLKIDFPRVPLTSNAALFRKLCALGADLVALHLLEDDYEAASWNASGSEGKSPLANLSTRFDGKGGREVAKGHPKYKDCAVYINSSSRFECVPEEVWDFRVGGHKVCEKWLKERRGRSLSDEDLAHYRRVVAAIFETIRLMSEIDRAIEEHGGWPLAGGAGIPARKRATAR